MLTKIFIFLSLSFSTSLWAMPKKFEIWALKVDRNENVTKLISKKNFIAQNCIQKIGDECFDPQVGIYTENEKKKVDEVTEVKVEPFAKCDPNNKFDIFCGKEGKIEKKNQKQEVWVSTAKSMQVVDGECARASFLKQVAQSCRPAISVFDSSKKELGTFQDACVSKGEPNTERLIDNIKNSKASKLVVILDISQVTQEIRDFVALSNGKGTIKELLAKELPKNVTTLCR